MDVVGEGERGRGGNYGGDHGGGHGGGHGDGDGGEGRGLRRRAQARPLPVQRLQVLEAGITQLSHSYPEDLNMGTNKWILGIDIPTMLMSKKEYLL